MGRKTEPRWEEVGVPVVVSGVWTETKKSTDDSSPDLPTRLPPEAYVALPSLPLPCPNPDPRLRRPYGHISGSVRRSHMRYRRHTLCPQTRVPPLGFYLLW